MRISWVVVCLGCISGCGDSVLVEGTSGDNPPQVPTGTSTGSTGTGTTGTTTGSTGTGTTSTTSSTSEYAAAAWPGGLDHIIIMRADAAQDSCIRVQIDAPSMGSFSVSSPSPWGVGQITGWSSSLDCLDWQLQPPGTPVSAASATGSVSWQLGPNMFYPCDLDVAITLTFDDVPPWSSGQETLAAQAISVEGGCF